MSTFSGFPPMSAPAAVRGQVSTKIELKMITDRLVTLHIQRPTFDMAPSFLALHDWSLLQYALLSGQERNSRKFGLSAEPTSTVRFRIELNDASDLSHGRMAWW